MQYTKTLELVLSRPHLVEFLAAELNKTASTSISAPSSADVRLAIAAGLKALRDASQASSGLMKERLEGIKEGWTLHAIYHGIPDHEPASAFQRALRVYRAGAYSVRQEG